MNRSDYQQMQALITSQIREFVSEFAQSPGNQQVYALALDINEDYCDVILCINTEESLSRRVSFAYPDHSEDEIGGIHGIRFNPGEFEFSQRLDLGDLQRKYESKIESLKTESSILRNHEQLSAAATGALLESRDAYWQLNCTEHFIFYHCFHDLSTQQSQRLLEKTVEREAFNSCFPEIIEYEKLRADISNREHTEQVQFWVSLLRAHAIKRPTAYSTLYFQTHGTWDIEEELASLGQSIVAPAIELLEELALLPPFNEKNSPDFAEDGAISRASLVACDLLFALKKLGHVPESAVESLRRILSELFDRAEAVPENEPASLVIPNIVRTLHALFPKRFPPEQLGDKNRIDNIGDYLCRT